MKQNSSIVHRGLIFTIYLLFCVSNTAIADTNYPSHSGDSPISYDQIAVPNGEFVISDRQPGVLDQYMFRDSNAYQITVMIPIHRYIGVVDTAIAKGVVSETAKIYIPAYDIDASTYPEFDCDGDGVPESFQPEIDKVYLNGELIGELRGEDSLWKFNDSFEVPIEKLNFPSSPGEVAQNEISIAIDTGNKDAALSGGGVGCKVWATSIDWVGVKFSAAKPIYLMTGLFGNPGAFEKSGYVDNLKSTLGLYSKIIDHNVGSASSCEPLKLDAISEHADEFITQIVEDGNLVGTAQVHLVGHSMGGLDGRMLIKKVAEKDYPIKVSEMDGSPVYENLLVKSILTHGTPHNGTLVADYLPVILPISDLSTDICELRVDTWKIANSVLDQLYGVKYMTIGGDADIDQSGDLNESELTGNQIPSLSLGNKLYSLLYRHDELTLDYTYEYGSALPRVTYIGNGANPNDTMVTLDSSHGLGNTNKLSMTVSDGKNHGTIIDAQSQNAVIPQGTTILGWRDL